MSKIFRYIKVTLLSFVLFLSLIPNLNVHAYSSPYYATKLNGLPALQGQASQVVAKGNILYVSSYAQCYVYKVINETTVQTVAGISGQCGYSPDGSVAASSTIQGPSSIDVGPDGTVYIAEPHQHHIRAVLPDGTLETIAGNGTVVNQSLLTDAPDATQTPFNYPAYVRISPDGAVHTYDDGVIRRILPDGSTDHAVGDFGAAPNNNPYVEGGIANQHYFATERFSSTVNGASWCVFDFDQEGNLYTQAGNKIYKINSSDNRIYTFHNEPANPTTTLEDAPLSTVRFGEFGSFDIDSEDRIWSGKGGGSGVATIAYTSPAEQIVHTAAGGDSTPAPALATNLRLANLRSISVDNGQIYYIGFDSDNGFYVGKLSTTIPDPTPPTVLPHLSSQPDVNGWHYEPVDLTWEVNDSESNITSTVGCDPITITVTSTHTCTATSSGGVTSQSVTITIVTDSSAPVLHNPSWSQNPKQITSSSALSIPITDNFSGIQRGEYYIGDNDPGQGNGVPMQLTNISNGGLNADLTTTFGTNLATGIYKVNVRAQDNVGNWSNVTTDYLTVIDTNPAGLRTIGRWSVVPSLANNDVLPGLINSYQTDEATFTFNARYNSQHQIHSGSNLEFEYKTGTFCANPNLATNCHKTKLNATNIDWFTTQGTNNNIGVFQGTGNLTIDNQSSSVTFRVTVADGSRLNPVTADKFQLHIYTEGSNPNTAQPVYSTYLSTVVDGDVKILY